MYGPVGENREGLCGGKEWMFSLFSWDLTHPSKREVFPMTFPAAAAIMTTATGTTGLPRIGEKKEKEKKHKTTSGLFSSLSLSINFPLS